MYNEPIHTLGARSTATSASEGTLKTDMVGMLKRRKRRKTEAERRATHKRLYGTSEVPPRQYLNRV